MAYVYDIFVISKNTTEITVYEIQSNGYAVQIYNTTESDTNSAIAQALTDLLVTNPDIKTMTLRTKTDQTITTTLTGSTASSGSTLTSSAAGSAAQTATNSNSTTDGSGDVQTHLLLALADPGPADVVKLPTPVNINSPDTTAINTALKDINAKIKSLQEIGLPGIKDAVKAVWTNAIQPKLMTQRQIAKKYLIMQGQSYDPPMAEEDAQRVVYGKLYFKGGKLYDNDLLDPKCIAQPGDEDYHKPMDENHPIWQKIVNMIKDLENSIMQLAIKLGEFTFALPNAIAVIAVSLVALVSSMVILPPGSGVPTAISAVQTMLSTIKELQAKTAVLLPLLAILDTIGLLLPKSAQAVIAQINVIVVMLVTIIAVLNTILGLLGAIVSKVSSSTAAMKAQGLSLTTKADPATVKLGQSSNLTATATGGDWNFTYQWTDPTGTIIGSSSSVTVTPTIPAIVIVTNPPTATYTCKVTDGTGTSATSTTIVTRG